jgi:hypothetical protein
MPLPRSEQPAAGAAHVPTPPVMGLPEHLVRPPMHAAQSASVLHLLGLPARPQTFSHSPTSVQTSLGPGQPLVSEHLAQTPRLQAWFAGAPFLPPHSEQSVSAVQAAGHVATQALPLHTSVDWQFVTFAGVQPTHFLAARSHTLKFGPHAAQPASLVQVMVGTPFGSSAQVVAADTQSPYFVQVWPAPQLFPLACGPHATQRCSFWLQVVRAPEQSRHSRSVSQLLSRQMLAPSEPDGLTAPPSTPSLSRSGGRVSLPPQPKAAEAETEAMHTTFEMSLADAMWLPCHQFSQRALNEMHQSKKE